jgi:hypothetical protein
MNTSRGRICTLSVVLFTVAIGTVNSQNVANDGAYGSRYVVLKNTTEAELMVRSGDVDNLGLGLPTGFDPFSGESTPVHIFPWEGDFKGEQGFDMIMVPESFGQVEIDCGTDGYSDQKELIVKQTGKSVHPLKVKMTETGGMNITSVRLMMFLDDFQSPVFCTKFQILLNGRRAVFMENVVNKLNQTGPIGKLVTIDVPADFVQEFSKPEVIFIINDTETGAGDGFAVDFIKVLINPKKAARVSSLEGLIVAASTGEPVVGAIVKVAGYGEVLTNEHGFYKFAELPAGMNILDICVTGYLSQSFPADVVENEKNILDIQLAGE